MTYQTIPFSSIDVKQLNLTKKGRPIRNVTGVIFHSGIVASSLAKIVEGQTYWNFKCFCGQNFVATVATVENGRKVSCGCAPVKQDRYSITDDVDYRVYKAWKAMKERCYNEKHESYMNYGGRGITVCSKWLNNVYAFAKDMGVKPSIYHSLDRINNDGNYEPTNCKWSTPSEQRLNQRIK